MSVYINCEASPSVLEADDCPQGQPESYELGPFDYVQMTYGMLRVGDEERTENGAADSIGGIGEFDAEKDVWLVWINGIDKDPCWFSDLVIYTKEN